MIVVVRCYKVRLKVMMAIMVDESSCGSYIHNILCMYVPSIFLLTFYLLFSQSLKLRSSCIICPRLTLGLCTQKHLDYRIILPMHLPDLLGELCFPKLKRPSKEQRFCTTMDKPLEEETFQRMSSRCSSSCKNSGVNL